MPWTPNTRGWGASRRGNDHVRNEDAFVLLDHPSRTRGTTNRGSVYAVSDGVSTVSQGHWASQLTVSRLSQFFDGDGQGEADSMIQLISEIDWEIRGQGSGKAACTLAAVWVLNEKVWVFQVGDSHVFRVRDGKAQCLTTGEEEQGRKLDHFLGMGPAVSEVISVSEHPVEVGDALILVTDGVTNHVDAEVMGQCWTSAHGDPAACTESLLAVVARNQGGDDATAVAALIL
ncbi:MAG: PP2C family protein-serine/threonine phosphatase [Myxococcota bacterium]